MISVKKKRKKNAKYFFAGSLNAVYLSPIFPVWCPPTHWEARGRSTISPPPHIFTQFLKNRDEWGWKRFQIYPLGLDIFEYRYVPAHPHIHIWIRSEKIPKIPLGEPDMFKRQMTSIAHDDEWNDLGTGRATKMDEFSEKFQTAFALPPPYWENYVANLFRKAFKKHPI